MELEADIPVGDAVALEKGAEVKFFLNASPTSPLEAELTRVAYRASATADGTLAYKARAEFVQAEGDAPQLGLKGTAKFYGEETFLGLYLLPASGHAAALARRLSARLGTSADE